MTTTTNALQDEELYFIASGIVACSVCAPADWDRPTVERETNRKAPTGISSCWAIADEDFASGAKNGCECDQVAGRKHWLLQC